MRLLTWNIHKGIGGVDRRYNLGRILEVITHYNPDIAVLQEVTQDHPRTRHHDQVKLIAQVLDFNYVEYGPNVWLKNGCYGNATLSRYPIVNARNIDLAIGVKKSRGALYTEVKNRQDGHQYTTHLLNIHLGLSGMERRMQIKRLLESEELQRLPSISRVIIAGDTNDWNGALGRGKLLRNGYDCVTGRGRRASLTFPAWQPVGALDRVFARGPIYSDHYFRGRSKICRQASDHLPVITDFAMLPR